jgi:hypothetical protein
MNNIEQYRKRFNMLIESSMGDVRPLLFEDANPQFSQFTKDFAKMIGVTEEEVSYVEAYNENLDQNTRKKIFDLNKDQMKNISIVLAKAARSNMLDEMVKQLKSYSKPMTQGQKEYLDEFVNIIEYSKPRFEKFKSMPQDQWDKYLQAYDTINQPKPTEQPDKVTTTDTTQPGDKINTTNDRTYDYKLSGGKYYYSKKNENNWIEAKGKGLDAIKTKIKF